MTKMIIEIVNLGYTVESERNYKGCLMSNEDKLCKFIACKEGDNGRFSRYNHGFSITDKNKMGGKRPLIRYIKDRITLARIKRSCLTVS